MKEHGRPRMGPWVLLVGVIGLVAGHVVLLYNGLSHTSLSAAVVSGVIVLIVIKHLGLLGPLYALFRRGRPRP
jgi:drug/metabolite transporter (DMT)-like permease